MNLRIFLICSVLPPFDDAVGEAAIKLKILLEKYGYDCSILTSYNQKVDKEIFPFIRKWGLIDILKSVHLLKKYNTNVVIFYYPTPLYKRNIFVTIISLIYRISGIKFISYIHEYSNYSFWGKIRIFPLLFFGNRIITSDHNNYYSIIKIPFLKKKATIISVGSNFPDELFNSDKYQDSVKTKRDNRKFQLLYFGYLMEGKGLEILINTFDKFPYLKEKFALHIVGKTPEFISKKSFLLLKKIKISDHIIWHGFVERGDLIKIYAYIDLVCLLFEDGLTIRRGSFMTAMAFGKPVLTTMSHYKIDGLKHLENVIFLNSLKESEIADSLSYIIKLDKNKLIEIGNKARIWYQQNYSEEIYIKKIIEILSGL